MKLVESGPCDLPVALLVKIAQCHRVCERLVEMPHDFLTYFDRETDRNVWSYRVVWLNLICIPMHMLLSYFGPPGLLVGWLGQDA